MTEFTDMTDNHREWLQRILYLRAQHKTVGFCLLQNTGLNAEYKPECGPMPNVMVTLPNIGGALCSTPQSLADVHY